VVIISGNYFSLSVKSIIAWEYNQPSAIAEVSMLYPQSNTYRQVIDLSGFWDFRFDPKEVGQEGGWQTGFTDGRPIAVPASWNEQFEDGRDFLGPAWYQTRFDLPWEWDGKRIILRFGSVNYLTESWLNGHPLTPHEGGHLPFEYDVTSLVRPAENRIVLRVDGRLAFDRVPPGNVTGTPQDFFPSHAGNYPQAQFDFFPYCGIHRPVLLYATSHDHINNITVQTTFSETTGKLGVRVEGVFKRDSSIRFHLTGHGHHSTHETVPSGNFVEAVLNISDVALWSPAHPNLYNLSVELIQNASISDSYSLKVGVRTIRVDGDQLLLNEQPIHLKGFGRHEDFPVIGRGYLPALIVKDYALMKWVGANSFRTSHYPYSEQMLDLADQLGILVIDETSAVGLYFREDGLEKRNQLCRQYVNDLIARDRNHPSVIAWSLANEPHSVEPDASALFHDLYQQAKELDSTRPVTLVSFLGEGEKAFEFCDLVCLNRYYGWYSQPGNLEEALPLLSAELDALHEKFHKPILLAEFGADAIPGHHAQPPEMFSEEYQAEMISRYIELLRQKSYVIGEHVWNLCDFKTSQGITRVGALNHKGIFTRDRRPKLAAHRLRELWNSTS
jgi:beta-glucuronidase